MKYAALAKTEKNIADFLPYTRFVDSKTLRTKDGYLLQIIKLHGIAFETADQDMIEHYKDVRATFLRGLTSSRFALYNHIIRREINIEQDSFFENDFARKLNKAYHDNLSHKRMFINEQYITIVMRPERGAIGVATAIGRTFAAKIDKKLHEEKLTQEHKMLSATTESLLKTLSSYGAEILKIEQTDTGTFAPALSFLSYILNGEAIPHRLPRAGIDETLPRKRISFGKETFEIRGAAPSDIKLGAVISVKDYPDSTCAGMLDGLLSLPHEFTITQSFACIDRNSALIKIRDVKRKMMAGEEGAATLEDELEIAIDNVASGISSFGEHHLSICVTERNAINLEQAINASINAFTTLGVIAVREDLNMEPAFWAQFPGNFSYISRKALISSQNFSGFASLHNSPVGQKYNNHWGQAVTCLETTSGTPYWFNFHFKDTGSTAIYGPTGAGKTMALNFLNAQCQKFMPKTFYFDKDRGSETYLRALGGEYSVVSPGKQTGLNPLQLDDSQENRAFLREWLQIIIKGDSDKNFTAKERDIIADAVNANYDAPPEHRKLSILAKLFGGFESFDDETLADRLSMWHSGGERSWLFDNESDNLSLEQKTIGFDMTSILDDPISRTPWLFYIFHRIENALDGQKTIIILDEAWKLLDDAVFSKNIKDWLKTIRKKNGIVVFATQSIADAVTSSVGNTIVEQCPTQIFLPNPKARKEDYCGAFMLTQKELQTIRNIGVESRCFLIKHGQTSVIARLDLNGMDDFIPILSGRAENNKIMNELRGINDNPDIWIPQFIEKVNS